MDSMIQARKQQEERERELSFEYPPLNEGISRLRADIVQGLRSKKLSAEVLSESRIATKKNYLPFIDRWMYLSCFQRACHSFSLRNDNY